MVLTEGFSKLSEYKGSYAAPFQHLDCQISILISHVKIYLFDLNLAKWFLLHIISNNIMYLKIPLGRV